VTNGSCSLTWNAPEDDGGSPVIGYYVESYIGSSWSTVNSTPITTCSISIELVVTSSDNFFRICAVNTVGVGPPSETVSTGPTDIGLSIMRVSISTYNSYLKCTTEPSM